MSTQSKSMQELWKDSYLASGNEGYLEDLYETYLSDPQQLAPEWRTFFDQMVSSMSRNTPDVPHAAIKEQFLALARQSAHLQASQMVSSVDERQERVTELINAYRRLGHLQANIDPLGFYKGIYNPALEQTYYGFTAQDQQTIFNVGSFTALNKASATLGEIHDALRRTYSSSIGFEYMHITRAEEVEWIRERIEQGWANFKPTNDEKRRILDRLVVADGLEKYIGFKYVGQKRFSLEGGDSLIPLLDVIINRGVQNGVKEAVIGMAHRGRLNVLANIVGKNPKDIFAAFEGSKSVSDTNSGDVKYHLGCSSNVNTPYGPVHIALAFNPSHLEIVSPVVQGSVRARQRRRRNTEQNQVLTIQVHGDAAFAGQGVVMETFNMSQIRWFGVGGSIHVVINNQIGFTTSNPKDSRSTTYCTDVAKMVEAPILHVNGNDPEAAYFAALFAIDYHFAFKKDVVIDLVCYRRHGHNEADEPSATQPVMYKTIKAMQVPYVIYARKLLEQGVIENQAEVNLANAYRDALDNGKPVLDVAKESSFDFNVNWEPFLQETWQQNVVTGVPLAKLKTLAAELEKLPEGFVVQPQVKKILEAQRKMTDGELPLNWGYAETMAYATLLDEGYPIRLCGQDAGRGTFAHRHAVLHDQETDETYIPLSHVSSKQVQINIVDSFLSEEAVLAFEYGYATAEPNYLVIWEAQFGDFANGAQVVIDQFISSGEQKWHRLCGLVMLLPHGYEGMGPEHSSARLERYLQLCAQDNMQVCVPSTPAQIFHLLRRQMVRPYRKPLIVMTPKSLLRNPLATSSLTDLSEGEFQIVIPEVDQLKPAAITRVVICSGKIYYELLAKRREEKLDHIAIIRIEQLYPFPVDACKKALGLYKQAKQIVWCQEEPQNQGAWIAMQPYISQLLANGQVLGYAGRAASASPAVGYHSVHEKEQHDLVAQALMS